MRWPLVWRRSRDEAVAAKDMLIDSLDKTAKKLREQRDDYSGKYLAEKGLLHAALNRLDTTYVRIGSRYVRYIDAGLPDPLPPSPEKTA